MKRRKTRLRIILERMCGLGQSSRGAGIVYVLLKYVHRVILLAD